MCGTGRGAVSPSSIITTNALFTNIDQVNSSTHNTRNYLFVLSNLSFNSHYRCNGKPKIANMIGTRPSQEQVGSVPVMESVTRSSPELRDGAQGKVLFQIVLRRVLKTKQ